MGRYLPITCEHCGITFQQSVGQTNFYPHHFCSKSCRAKYYHAHREYKRRKCVRCGNVILTRAKFYCSRECQIETKKQRAIKQWQDGTIEAYNTNGTVRPFLRKYLIEKANYCCCKCGFNTSHPISNTSILEIHHIDGDYKNNDDDNLLVLCPNCHALTDNYRNRNKNEGRVCRRKKPYGGIAPPSSEYKSVALG